MSLPARLRPAASSRKPWSSGDGGDTRHSIRVLTSPLLRNPWRVPAGTTTSPSSGPYSDHLRPLRNWQRPSCTTNRSSIDGCTCAPAPPPGSTTVSMCITSPSTRNRWRILNTGSIAHSSVMAVTYHPLGLSKRKRLTAAERRVLIENAAVEVFAERGYQRASMEEIAKRSGISVPVLYDHFSNKLDLYKRLLERTRNELLEMWGVHLF